MDTPAERAIKAFDGHANLAQVVGRDVSRIHRWTYPKERGGSDGLIPSELQGVILAAARKRGLNLSADDLIALPRRKAKKAA